VAWCGELQALPAYYSALKALESLDKKQIQEVKSFASPPKAVQTVMFAVCLLLGKKETWEESKKLLNDINFLNSLREYDKVGAAGWLCRVLPRHRRRACSPFRSHSVCPLAAVSLCLSVPLYTLSYTSHLILSERLLVFQDNIDPRVISKLTKGYMNVRGSAGGDVGTMRHSLCELLSCCYGRCRFAVTPGPRLHPRSHQGGVHGSDVAVHVGAGHARVRPRRSQHRAEEGEARRGGGQPRTRAVGAQGEADGAARYSEEGAFRVAAFVVVVVVVVVLCCVVWCGVVWCGVVWVVEVAVLDGGSIGLYCCVVFSVIVWQLSNSTRLYISLRVGPCLPTSTCAWLAPRRGPLSRPLCTHVAGIVL
jgi:hypothetical protein